MLKEVGKSSTQGEPAGIDSPLQTARDLSEVTRILREFEGPALAQCAQVLSMAAASLTETASKLEAMRPVRWLDAEGVRARYHIKEHQWKKIASRLPRHYFTERGILYDTQEIDELLRDARSPERSVAG